MAELVAEGVMGGDPFEIQDRLTWADYADLKIGWSEEPTVRMLLCGFFGVHDTKKDPKNWQSPPGTGEDFLAVFGGANLQEAGSVDLKVPGYV